MSNRIDVRETKRWMREHPEVVETMDIFAAEIAKGSWGKDEKMGANTVKRILNDFDCEGAPHAWQILFVWQKFHSPFKDDLK